MSTRPICCGDLSAHIAVKHVVWSGGFGLCFVVHEDQKRRLVPIFHCPWCGSELQPEGERAHALSYAP